MLSVESYRNVCVQIDKHSRQFAASSGAPAQCSDRQGDSGGGSVSDADGNNDDASNQQNDHDWTRPSSVERFDLFYPNFLRSDGAFLARLSR